MKISCRMFVLLLAVNSCFLFGCMKSGEATAPSAKASKAKADKPELKYVNTDIQKVKELVAAGDADAMAELAERYYVGVKGVSKDVDESYRLVNLAIEKGNNKAKHAIGLFYLNGQVVPQDVQKALNIFKTLSDNGSVVAEVILAKIYIKRLQNIEEGAKWYTKSAEHGDAESQVELGFMYERGTGVPKDYKEALRLYKMAAEQGAAVAQENIAILYLEGYGVAKDYNESFKWAKKAAEQGLATSMNIVGISYSKGEGTAKDFIQAYMWYNLSISKGNEDARRNLEKIERQMTPQQIEAAQKLTREWKPKTPEQP